MAPPRLVEAHYCNLTSQSNIYGLTKFAMPDGVNKILVASLMGKVISLEFQKTNPLSREVHFTYIPGDAEVISIDAFTEFTKGQDTGIKVGVCFTKYGDENLSHYFNIYTECEKDANYNLDRIAQGCQTLDLNFVPYQLYHTKIVTSEGLETVFLLSGGDQRIHLFRPEDNLPETVHFTEDATEDFFPEFSDLPCNVTCMWCEYLEGNSLRCSVVGCIDGTVCMSLVATDNLEILKQWTIQHDSAVSSISFFKLLTDVPQPDYISQVYNGPDDPLPIYPEYNLLVTSALEAAVVYRNVLEKGLSMPLILPGSDNFDSVLCSLVADVDFDGQNEIFLGCYGQELLLYKFYPRSVVSVNSTPERPSPYSQHHQHAACSSLSDISHCATSYTTPIKPTNDSQLHSLRTQSKSHPSTPTLKSSGSNTPKVDRTGSYKSEPGSNSNITPNKLDQSAGGDGGGSSSGAPYSTYSSSTPVLTRSTTPEDSKYRDATAGDDISVNGISTSSLLDGEFRLEWQRKFSDPVLALDEVDITGDGLKEIIVVSLKGVHVLQHNISEVAQLCLERLRHAKTQQELHQAEMDDIQKFLSENILGTLNQSDIQLMESATGNNGT